MKGRDFIKKCEDLYEGFSTKYPSRDPHEYLVLVLRHLWNFRTVTTPNSSPADVAKEMEIWTYCFFPACLKPPLCARYLAYQIILDDKPFSYEEFTSQFPGELEAYYETMDHLSSASSQGTLREIYCKFNKNPLFGKFFFPMDD